MHGTPDAAVHGQSVPAARAHVSLGVPAPWVRIACAVRGTVVHSPGDAALVTSRHAPGAYAYERGFARHSAAATASLPLLLLRPSWVRLR